MPNKANSCTCSSSKKKRKKRNNPYPFLSGLLIALLPKCPWCILAYSSAITMCSGTKFYTPTDSWTTYLPISFAVFTLALLLYNYKGKKTILAATLVLLGSCLILDATFYYGDATAYYFGSLTLLFGVWINGSFFFFVRKFKSYIKSWAVQKEKYPNTLHSKL